MRQAQVNPNKNTANYEYYSTIAPMSATFQQYRIGKVCSDTDEEIYALDFNNNTLDTCKNYARHFLPKQ